MGGNVLGSGGFFFCQSKLYGRRHEDPRSLHLSFCMMCRDAYDEPCTGLQIQYVHFMCREWHETWKKLWYLRLPPREPFTSLSYVLWRRVIWYNFPSFEWMCRLHRQGRRLRVSCHRCFVSICMPLKMEAALFSPTLLNFFQNTWCYNWAGTFIERASYCPWVT
jgi:hypothetical protein